MSFPQARTTVEHRRCREAKSTSAARPFWRAGALLSIEAPHERPYFRTKPPTRHRLIGCLPRKLGRPVLGISQHRSRTFLPRLSRHVPQLDGYPDLGFRKPQALVLVVMAISTNLKRHC